MEMQPLVRRQPEIPCFGIVAVHLAKHLQHVATFGGEVLRHLNELPASMRQTVGQKDLRPRSETGHIAR